MIFSKPISIGSEVPGMGVQNDTSPNTATFGNGLYLFYNGSGEDGIWYTDTLDGVGWSSLQNAAQTASGMGVLTGTNASAVAFGDQIYLFFAGSGEDGIWYTTTLDGVTWTPVQNVPESGVQNGTSPYVMQFGNGLYLFINDGDGIWYTVTLDGVGWSSWQNVAQMVSGMGVLTGTNASAVAFGDQIYLFYAGSGADGIWYTTTLDGDTWTPVQNVPQTNSGRGFNIPMNVSMNAAQLGNELYLFYNGSDWDGVWYTSTADGVTWSSVNSMAPNMVGGVLGLMEGTGVSVVQYNSTLYVFWNGAGGDGIYYSYAIQT